MTTADDAHLLIVDDDERIRSLLQKFLMRSGFLVSSARDAAHARRVLSGLEFDLIVLDVMMPGEDGVSLCRDLRSKMPTPILLLTAKGETDARVLRIADVMYEGGTGFVDPRAFKAPASFIGQATLTTPPPSLQRHAPTSPSTQTRGCASHKLLPCVKDAKPQ